MMDCDLVAGLQVLRGRLNEKKDISYQHLNILDRAINEINKLRYSEALLEDEILMRSK